MGFWTLFEVASTPILQVLIISSLGAFMSTGYSNLLSPDTRKSLNKIVFMVFTPCLMFANLAKTVTLQDIISWWFMPVNIGLTFLFGGILGWLLVKLIKPEPYLEGLVIATSSAGNLGNLLLIIVPAVCTEDGSPFEDNDNCSSIGLSYASFSMALGGFYIWTYSYHLIRNSAVTYKALQEAEAEHISKSPNNDFDANQETLLLKEDDQRYLSSTKSIDQDTENQAIVEEQGEVSFWNKLKGILYQIVEELMAPPTIGAAIGFIFGTVTWLRNLVIGDDAPLRVIQDSVKLLGDGTIPCITLILGGNLIQGLRASRLKISVIIGILCVRYLFLPVIGIGVVKAATSLGFLSSDPLYHYVLMVQFTLPPAMNIATMTQLFDVGQEECSVILLWTYVVAALALTAWSTVYMWILS